jgi:hypothetical protein
MKVLIAARTWGKRLVISLLVLCAILSAGLLVERFRGSLALKARLAELTQKGEKLKVADLEPLHPAPAENAVAALLSLTNRLELAASNAVLSVMPPLNRYTSPGKLVMASMLAEWSENKVTNSWKDVEFGLTQDPGLLEAIHQGSLRPGWDDGFSYHNGFLNFPALPIVHWKRIAQLLDAATLSALHDGRTDVALDRMEDSLRLVRRQTASRLIISELVRDACATIAWQASWELVVSGRCNESQLARLQSAWENLDFVHPMEIAIEMERAMTLDHFRLLLASHEAVYKLAGERETAAESGFGTQPPFAGSCMQRIYLRLWEFSWSSQDELHAINRWQDIIDFSRRASETSWGGVSKQAAELDATVDAPFVMDSGTTEVTPKTRFYDRLRYLVSSDTMIGSNTVKRALEIEAMRRLMVTAIALERYRLERGKYPVELRELVLDLIKAVPVDPMDGKPLHYKLSPEGKPMPYSVGEDGQDDGGDCSPANAANHLSKIWDGKDAVWPTPAPQNEAKHSAHRQL